MKTAKYYFFLTATIVFFAVPAFAGLEIRVSEAEPPLLIGKSNPILAGVEQLCVVIVAPDAEPNESGLVWKDLKAKAENELTQSGIKIISCPEVNIPSDNPELRIEVNILKPENSALYVFHVQTSLARLVCLGKDSNLFVKADVCKISSAMQTSLVETTPAAITGLVLKQVDAFIHFYLAANPSGKSASDVNNAPLATELPKITEPYNKPSTPQYKYIASKKGKVFHKAGCVWVTRIKPENLVGYNVRDEALGAGKRPCKLCEP